MLSIGRFEERQSWRSKTAFLELIFRMESGQNRRCLVRWQIKKKEFDEAEKFLPMKLFERGVPIIGLSHWKFD